MKIRITLLTENDKHFDESIAKERIEEQTKLGWQMVMDLMAQESSDKAIVESCELVER